MTGMEPLQDQTRNESVDRLTASKNEKSSAAYKFSSFQIHSLQVSSNHVNSLPTNISSSRLQPLRAIPAGHIPEGVVLPITGLDAGKRTFDFQSVIKYENTGVPTNPFEKRSSNYSTHDFDTSRAYPFLPIQDRTDAEAATKCPVKNHELMEECVIPKLKMLQSGCSKSNIEVESTNMSNNQYDIHTKSHASIKQETDEEINTTHVPHSQAIVPLRDVSARNLSHRLRRAKITEGIKALQNSVPCSDKGNKESVLDDAIDYIKFLKLQFKVLSQSRLCGEATPYPFVHLEGYGHYLFHHQMCTEPLEEVMGQLMGTNMQAANELLESKGLTILPMDLAYTLLQTS